MTRDSDTQPSAAGDAVSFREIFDRAVADARADLALTAQQVRASAFCGDGIGHVGAMFRALRDQQDRALEREQWADLLSLASEMWSDGHHDASVQLLKDARIRLSPPEEFQEHFEQSITFGEEYIIFLRAKKRFDEGETEEAKEMLEGLSPETRADLDEQISTLGARRRKTRRKAFTTAGVMGAVLLAATIYSLVNLVDFLRNPPTLDRDNFNISRAFPDIEFPDIPARQEPGEEGSPVDAEADETAAADAADGPAPELTFPTSPDPLPATGSERSAPSLEEEPRRGAGDFRLEDVFGEGPEVAGSDAGVEMPPAGPAPETGRPDLRDDTAAPRPLPDQPSPAEQPEPTVPAADEASALLGRCALALRVSAAASRDAQNDAQIQRADAFRQKFLAACSDAPFDIETLQEEASRVDEAEVLEISANVLQLR